MAVEILVLSGARQGDRLVLDGRQFQVGSDSACEVLFDAQRDHGIKGRSAEFRLRDGGWHVHSAGGEVLVNQRPIVGWTRLRSGDLVRMSESGPDFSFRIVAASAAATSASASGYVPPPSSPPVSASSNGPATLELAPNSPPAFLATDSDIVAKPSTGTVAVQRGNVRETAESSYRPVPAPSSQPKVDRPWAIWAGIGLVVCLAGVLLLRPTVIVLPTPPVAPPVQPVVPTTPTVVATNPPPVTAVPPTAATVPPIVPAAQPPDITAQLNEAVFLIQVENTGRMWPYATCVAISNDTLLTTAREAAQLATWRTNEGFRIWVTRPAANFKEEVQDIRVHGVYASLTKKTNGWMIYFDLGLLTVRTNLPKAVPLASPEDLAALEEGLPVFCFGFTHEGETITRFDKFEPRLTPGKIKLITVSQELPVKARVLHIKAEIPKNAHGSPIVNAAGRIIGIYGEAAASPGGEGVPAGAPALKNLHYAPVVNPELIKLWLQDRSDKIWVPATAFPTSQSPQDNR